MKTIILLAIVALLAACSNPNDIVLGAEPLKQIVDNGDQFRKLSEEDRILLVAYLELHGVVKSFGATDMKAVAGRTVGEVMKDARAWKGWRAEQEVENKKKEAEATALKAKILAERQVVVDKLSQAVTVAVTNKKIHREDYSARRLYDELELTYAVENKTDKAIRQIKGRLIFTDPVGDKISTLLVKFEELIPARGTLKTNTGRVWEVRRHTNGNVEKVADAPFEGTKIQFEAESIAYVDGEVVRAPSLTD
jgi:hypothetical protein